MQEPTGGCLPGALCHDDEAMAHLADRCEQGGVSSLVSSWLGSKNVKRT